jgi:hypothetical protein
LRGLDSSVWIIQRFIQRGDRPGRQRTGHLHYVGWVFRSSPRVTTHSRLEFRRGPIAFGPCSARPRHV